MYKICFYAPVDAVDTVKNAMFDAGAGKIGNYDACCWQTLGHGQFRPLENSDPAIGKQGELEFVDEYKVEMVCTDNCVKEVISAMKKSHPYEEVAYDVWKLADL